jgi:hypothetical protein
MEASRKGKEKKVGGEERFAKVQPELREEEQGKG